MGGHNCGRRGHAHSPLPVSPEADTARDIKRGPPARVIQSKRELAQYTTAGAIDLDNFREAGREWMFLVRSQEAGASESFLTPIPHHLLAVKTFPWDLPFPFI